MKIRELRKKVSKDRPMKSVTLRMPEDVIQDLKRVAAALDYTGYQPLMRAYIGRGLRKDLEKIDGKFDLIEFLGRLNKLGVKEETIEKALEDLSQKMGSLTFKKLVDRGISEVETETTTEQSLATLKESLRILSEVWPTELLDTEFLGRVKPQILVVKTLIDDLTSNPKKV